MRIKTALASEVSREVLRECRSLSFRGNGEMCDALRYFRNTDKCFVTTIRDLNGKLLAWSLLLHRGRGWRHHEFMVYVRSSHRRLGLGSRLLKSAKRQVGTPIYVYPHDERSNGFYNDGLRKNELLPL